MVTIISSTSERVAQLSTLQRYAFYGFAFLLVFALMTATVRFLPGAVRLVWSAEGPRTEAEELRHNCLQLGIKLNQLIDQWLADRHKVEAREPTSQLQRQLQARDISMIGERAKSKYNKNFRDRAIKLFELAEERGLAEPKWKGTAKNAGGSIQRMQMVAKRLIRIGRD